MGTVENQYAVFNSDLNAFVQLTDNGDLTSQFEVAERVADSLNENMKPAFKHYRVMKVQAL